MKVRCHFSACLALLITSLARAEPQALLTSARPVYRPGESIPVTVVLDTRPEDVLAGFEIQREGQDVAPRRADGRLLWESEGGSIPIGTRKLSIDDLALWYDLDQPGVYEVRFNGSTLPERGAVRNVRSNPLTIRILASSPDAAGMDVWYRTVPLNDVWALNMPGTTPMDRRVNGLTKNYNSPEGRLLQEILDALNTEESLKSPAIEGFAVRGRGMAALRRAHDVLVKGKKPTRTFRTSDRITLVFFSKHYGKYVHLLAVEQWESTVQLSYGLVSHFTLDATSHIALVPIELSTTGAIRVEISPELSTFTSLDPDLSSQLDRAVCKPFAFLIVK